MLVTIFTASIGSVTSIKLTAGLVDAVDICLTIAQLSALTIDQL